MKHGLVTLVVIMIVKDRPTFKAQFVVCPVLGTSLLWRSTVAFTYLNPPSGLGLSPGLVRKNLVLFTSLLPAVLTLPEFHAISRLCRRLFKLAVDLLHDRTCVGQCVRRGVIGV